MSAFRRSLRRPLATSITALLAVHSALGANLYWDTNGATAGSGNADGPWDANTTSAWTTNTGGTTATTAWTSASDTAFFAAGTDFTGTRAITVNGTVGLAGITIDSEVVNLTIGGTGTLDFGALTGAINTSAWATTTGKTLNLNAILAGSNGLTIASNGDLSATGGGNSSITRLGGANTFTGNVTITSGLVAYTTNGAFGAAANKIILNGGGLLDPNANVALSRDIEVQAGGGTFRLYGSANSTWSGAITGSGNINRTDGGTLNLTGDLSAYAGTYDNLGGSITVVNGTAAAGGTWKVSAGTLRVGANAFANTAALALNAGTFSSNAAAGAGDRSIAATTMIGGNLTIGDATNTGALSFSNTVNLGGAVRTLTIPSAVTFSNVVSNGGITKVGAGTLSLGATNTYAGATTVTGGTLSVIGSIASSASTTVTGSTLNLDYGATNTSKLNDAGPLVLNHGATLQISGNSGDHVEQAGSVIVNGGARITRSGTGAAVVDLGAFVNNGVLDVGAVGLARTTPAATGGLLPRVTFAGGTQLAAKDTSGNIVAYSTTYNELTRLSSGAKALTSDPAAVARIIEGTGTAGNITVPAGTPTDVLSLLHTATGGATTVDLTGGTLRLGTVGQIITAPGSAALTIQNGALTAGSTDNNAGEIFAGVNGGQLVITAPIVDNGTGAVSLRSAGPSGTAGTVTINRDTNTYTGGTTVSSGTLTVQVSTTAGAKTTLGTAAVNALDGSNLRFFTGSTGNAISFANAINLTNATLTSEDGVMTYGGQIGLSGANTVNVVYAGKNAIFSNGVSGTGSLTKVGAGDLILSGANAYSGGTTVSAGLLRAVTTASLPGYNTAGKVNVASGATLGVNVSGAGQWSSADVAAVLSANAAGFVAGSAIGLDTTNSPAPFVLTNGISGGLGLKKLGNGMLILPTAHTYSGGTTIGSGNVSIFSGIQIGDGGTVGGLGTGAIGFNGYGNNLVYARTNASSITSVISGTGSVIVKGGTLTLNPTAASTFTGDTIAYGGTIQFSTTNTANIGGRLIVYPGATAANTTTHVFGIGTGTAVQLLGGTFAGNGNEFYIGNLDLAGATLGGTGNEVRMGAGSAGVTRTINVLPSVVTSTLNRRLSVSALNANTGIFLVNDGPAVDDLIVSQNISSGTSIVKSGLGTLRSTTSIAHGYTGTTILNAGTFNLDFSGSSLNGNMLNVASAPTFAGGALGITGKANTPIAQTLGATTLSAGGSRIVLTPGSGAGTTSLTLGAIIRSTGATLGVSLPASTTLNVPAATGLTNGILPYAVVNGTDFATQSGGVVSGFAGYNPDDYSTAANNVDVISASPAPTTFGVNSLAFRTAGAKTLTLTGANTAGAILVGSNVGGNATTVASTAPGDSLRGTAGGELLIHQYNAAAGGELTISAPIVDNTSATALVKSGPGTLILTGTNTYTGTTFLNGGVLQYASPANIGNSTGAISFGGGTLRWATGNLDNVTTGRTVTIGVGGATFDTNGNDVTLGAFGTGSFGPMTKAGAGILTLGTANPNFTGSVIVNQGTLAVTNGTALGANQSQSIVVNSGATLTLNTNTLSAGHGSAVQRNLYINGGTLQNAAGATMRVGNVWLNGGTINTQNGSSGSYTTFYFGTLQDATQGANATVFVEGNTPSQITTTGTTNNAIQLGPNVNFQVADVTGNANADLTVSATLINQSQDQGAAAAALSKRGAGTMVLTAANSYTGGTFVESGTLQLGNNATTDFGGTGRIRGTITVAAGAALTLEGTNVLGYTGGSKVDAITLGEGSTLAHAGSGDNGWGVAYTLTGSTMQTTGTGRFSFGGTAGANTSITTLTSSNPSTIGGSVVLRGDNANTTLNVTVADGSAATDLAVSAVVSGTGVGITKRGAGTMVLSAMNSYTGLTQIFEGTVLVNGGITGSTTLNGGVLGGSGTIGALNLVSGILAPGNSPGVLNSGDVTFGGATFAVELAGITAGTGYDQLNVTGAINFTADTPLTLSLASFNPADFVDAFTIVNNDLADAIGLGGFAFTFGGTRLDEGAFFNAGGQDFQITYAGGSGNDVVLSAVPEPGTAMSLIGGFAVLLGVRRRRKA